jgi:hypothetical protein
MFEVAESVLEEIEREHSKGITSAALLNFFADKGIRFGEATLRKWVQLGLLPRSVRVGRKGKHQGSKGQYPVRVVRQIIRIKRLMADGMTIEEIQQRVLFVRGDLDSLEQTLDNIFGTLGRISEDDSRLTMGPVRSELSKARLMANDLVEGLERVEKQIIAAHRVEREVVAS